MAKKNIMIAPIVKWVGGKRQLLSEIKPLIPKRITTYVEPFLGGGAVLFDMQPKKAVINDYNSELINVYKIVKDNPVKLLELLEKHKENNNEDYYNVRALDRDSRYK